MEFDDIQNLYTKICLGYEILSIKGVDCFLKHHSYFDRNFLKKKYNEGISIAEKNGIKKEKDYLDFYIEKKWWSKDKEDQIRTISAFIENLKKSRNKLLLPSQKEKVSKTIEEEESKLSVLLLERKSIIPMTAEQFADKYYNKFYLHKSLYKNIEMNQLFAPNENYFLEELDELEYKSIWENIFEAIDFLKTENIKYLAATGFFQNLLMLSGKDMSAYNFYGKPVSLLTVNQVDLFSYGSSYRRSINNTTETIPDYILSDPLNLIDWCEGGKNSSGKAKSAMDKVPNKNKTRGERSGRMSSMVGASASDYKSLGIADLSSSSSKEFDLLSEAEKAGGEMLISQVVKKTDKVK